MGRKLHSKPGVESSVIYGWVGTDGKGRLGLSLPDGFRRGGASAPGFAFWRTLAAEAARGRRENVSARAVLCRITVEPVVSPSGKRSVRRFGLKERLSKGAIDSTLVHKDLRGQTLMNFGG